MLDLKTDVPMLPIVAHIRKGKEKAMGKNGRLMMGADLEKKFRIEFTPLASPEQFQIFKAMHDGTEYKANVYQKSGLTKRTDLLAEKIKFFFPFPDVNKVWDSNIEVYTASQMMGRGNLSFWEYLKIGQRVVVRDFKTVYPHQDDTGREYAIGDKRPYNEHEVIWTDKDGLPIMGKVKAKMFIMIPGFRLSHFVVHTTSWNDVHRIAGQLASIHQITQIIGHEKGLAGLPLVLTREPVEITKRHQSGEKFRGISYLLTIRIAQEWEDQYLPELSPSAYAHLLLPPASLIIEDSEGEESGNSSPENQDPGRGAIIEGENQVTPFILPTWVKLQPGTIVEDTTRLFYAVARQMLNMSGPDANKLLQGFDSDEQALEYLRTQVKTPGK